MPHSPEAGWPFWWRWVLATNVGWFSGILAGLSIAAALPEARALERAVVSAVVAGLFVGAAQAYVLRASIPDARNWVLATAIGWPVGVGFTRAIHPEAAAELGALHTILDAAVVAFGAGAVVGIAQACVLRSRLPRWGYWPLVSAVGWGILFPGALPGLALVWLWPRAGAGAADARSGVDHGSVPETRSGRDAENSEAESP